jgi:hypothetical protein
MDLLEVLDQIQDIYGFAGVSPNLDQDLLDVVSKVLERWPNPKLERMYRGYDEYTNEVGSDNELFQTLFSETVTWINKNK